MHQRGVVHCDIKPDNWLVRSDGRDVKLIDFGYAVNIHKLSDDTRLCGRSRVESFECTSMQRDRHWSFDVS